MALQEVAQSFLRRFQAAHGPLYQVARLQCRNYATDVAKVAEQETSELEHSAFLNDREVKNKKSRSFDPAAMAGKRQRRLPPSRYQFRSPRYFRGPLHPHQPLPPSDVASREFVPGPFSLPRVQQTYDSTFASDFMTLAYTHFPPGHVAHQKGDRLRPWVGESPYYKNRPLRGPRGGDALRPLRKPITFQNIPTIEKIVVHTMVKEAMDDSAHLHVAGMVLQAVTGVRATTHPVKKSVSGFGIRPGQYLSATCELRGEGMWDFLGKCVDVVMPRIKDWRGVKGSSGDESGTLGFGFTEEEAALFPEIEVNYDSYPPKMIPGFHVFVKTTAKNDSDARMLLTQLGIPFHGKLVN
ncbi:ribosomal protein L5 [Teratosphaeria nubilosa]|uniref:Large ribosomal subunit protein uL5m n=1 Tax=Teratosphaeria nubilosa TaxID=161662 RepID=A0A6G1L7F7_9PEZI|nr:ribosomal protein L5 [Teratosphaeria nubilosa]